MTGARRTRPGGPSPPQQWALDKLAEGWRLVVVESTAASRWHKARLERAGHWHRAVYWGTAQALIRRGWVEPADVRENEQTRDTYYDLAARLRRKHDA